MEGVKRERQLVRSGITRLVNQVGDELKKEMIDLLKLKVKRQRLTQLFTEIDRLDRLILEDLFGSEVDQQTIDVERDSTEEYVNKVNETFILLDEQLNSEVLMVGQKRPSSSSEMSTEEIKQLKNCKLPKIELRKFSGELKHWIGWWSQFSEIDKDEQIKVMDKFGFLEQAITKNSEARKVFDGYPPSTENYPKVINSLKERFGRSEILKQMYVRELIKLISSGRVESISELYYQLDAHTRSLTSLGVTSSQSVDFLYPMVESCLPVELLTIWQRHPNYGNDGKEMSPPVNQLHFLMQFLKTEVQNEEQRKMVKGNNSQTQRENGSNPRDRANSGNRFYNGNPRGTATAAGLSSNRVSCIFCGLTNHASYLCRRASSLSMEERKAKISSVKACFICFRINHQKRNCHANVKCSNCGGRHYHFMCYSAQGSGNRGRLVTRAILPPTSQSNYEMANVLAGVQCGGETIQKTVLVRISGASGTNGVQVARLLFDEGSQSSYVNSKIVSTLRITPFGSERVRNVMIDGSISHLTNFNKYFLKLQGLTTDDKYDVCLRERPVIGGIPPKVNLKIFEDRLFNNNVEIVDHDGVNYGNNGIDVLIGSDYREHLMTGNRLKLTDFVYAVESVFGWMICGPMERREMCASEIIIQSYFSGTVTDLWSLEVLGIRDPIDVLSEEERFDKTMSDFQTSIKRDEDGRYVVKLPWKNQEAKQCLSTNYHICKRRRERVVEKLEETNKLKIYSMILSDWMKEGLITRDYESVNNGHFLPHRPVFKENSSTPIRPVFDASCRMGNNPSINQMLEKGMNMLQVIPPMILRFRTKRIGVTSDLRKAFQMIKVDEDDQNYQKFLWIDGGKEIIYKHNRVVFGMNCSPFLLSAVLKVHLTGEVQEKETAMMLWKSLYVDNCVCSFDDEISYKKFKDAAVKVMADAKMDLRQWESNLEWKEKRVTSVLGLKWDKEKDVLYCNPPKLEDDFKVTKRNVLSVVAQIFDPIGFTSPLSIRPKILIQRAWGSKLRWDEEWTKEESEIFFKWYEELEIISSVQIPRFAFHGYDLTDEIEIHCFCDASGMAYASAVFVKIGDGVDCNVQLLASKARVSPLEKKSGKGTTIPRLELMGCFIASRLTNSVIETLSTDTPIHYWSDSSTALAWIRRSEDYGTFVHNRVKEIRKLTDSSQWRHVPGDMNPADLPSRGCFPNQLLESKWWEGPNWLRDKSMWPAEEGPTDEIIFSSELKKPAPLRREYKKLELSMMSSCYQVETEEVKFSSYLKVVRVAAWVRRFIGNYFKKKNDRIVTKFLTKEEMMAGESDVLRKVQEVHFGKCPQVENVVWERSFGHVGIQFVLGKLRERYWILSGKRSVRDVITACTVCRRFQVKPMTTAPAHLPSTRVECQFAFQNTGVDLIGPLTLKEGTKVWIVLYTCAVYRGVHLDLVQSLTTNDFMNSLERFVCTIGRPNHLSCDNGTNFVGAKGIMEQMDWKDLEVACQVKQIQWSFNPPKAPWWGGFWERLVKSVKDLLKRMLKNAKLTYDELLTCVFSIAGTINDRPLTVLTEDQGDLIPLTPRMFMRDIPIGKFPEGEELTADNLRESFHQLSNVKSGLRARFRKEYISLLIQHNAEKSSQVKVGDVVLVGLDDKRRFLWPLARVVHLYPGKDGEPRCARVKISIKSSKRFGTRFLDRPVKKLHPLEISTENEAVQINAPLKTTLVPPDIKDTSMSNELPVSRQRQTPIVTTRSGRRIKSPVRYGNWMS